MDPPKAAFSSSPSYAYAQPASPKVDGGAGNFKSGEYAQQVPTYGQTYGGPFSPQMHTRPVQPQAAAPTPEWRDLWAAILFYINIAIYVSVVGYLYYKARNISLNFAGFPKLPFDLVAIQMLLPIFLSFGLSVAALYAMYKQPKHTLNGCYIALFVYYGALAAKYARTEETYPFAIANGIAMLIVGLSYLIIRSRLDFTALVMTNVVECLAEYPFMLVASAAAAVAFSILYALFVVFIIAVVVALRSKLFEDDTAKTIAVVAGLFMTFSSLWNMGVVSNTLQTTVAGVYATWYFMSGTGNMPKNPTLDSGRRAVTYSFGSICIGSLIVAILQFLRVLLSIFNDKRRLSGAIADCLLKVLEELVKEFNHYVYTTIAIYGKPYMESAKDTKAMMADRGMDAVTGRNYVGAYVFIMSLAITTVTWKATCFAIKYFCPQYARNGLVGVWAIPSILYSMLICHTVFEVISAGSTATFVCLANNPEAMRRTRPVFYNSLRAAHPDEMMNF